MATYNGNSDTISKLAKGDIINYDYSGAVKNISLPKGQYKLECWGAQGGTGYTRTGTSSSSTSYTAIGSSNYSSYFTVSDDSYKFAPDSSGIWAANNLGVNSSTAQTTLTCTSAGTYKLTYSIVTESGYDKFTLVSNGTTIASAISGTQSSTATVTLSSNQTIVMTYVKDSSQSATGEKATVSIQKQSTNTTWSYGSATSYSGGKGGYSYGNLTVKEPTTVYVRAGGMGTGSNSTTQNTTLTAGFNGGGTGRTGHYQDGFTNCGSGGGASDIRIGSDDNYARVIVAGGGGGASGSNDSSKYGGGASGGSATTAMAATQTAAGTNGSFGQGANASTSYNYKYGSGGGGGGWYGGGSNKSRSDSDATVRQQNGGGSGYVYTSSTSANYPSGCKLNSAHYLTSASTVAGNTSFTGTGGNSETGHSGNGYVRITVLKIDTINMPVKVAGVWKTGDTVKVKIDGSWKSAEAVYAKIGGTWKQQ